MFYLKYLSIFSTFLLLSSYVNARCTGGSADHLLEARFSNCSDGKFIEKVREINKYNSKITRICMKGCYSTIFFNTSLKPECDKQYKYVLNQFPEIINLARQSGCQDSGSYNKQSVSSANSSCSWLIKTETGLTCAGSSVSNNICRVGSDAFICNGEVLCTSSFEFNGKILPSGIYNTTCLSKSGTCENIEQCFKDSNTSSRNRYFNEPIKKAIYSQEDSIVE